MKLNGYYGYSVFYYSKNTHNWVLVPISIVKADTMRKAVNIVSQERFTVRKIFLHDFSKFIEKESFCYVVVESKVNHKYDKCVYAFRFKG